MLILTAHIVSPGPNRTGDVIRAVAMEGDCSGGAKHNRNCLTIWQ